MMVGFRWRSVGHPRVPDGTEIRFTWVSWFRVILLDGPGDEFVEMILPDGSVELFKGFQIGRR